MSSCSLFSDLRKDIYGILHSDTTTILSYPEIGHDICFHLEDKSFWFKHRNNCIVEAIQQHPPEGMILDIGGGNGYVTRRLIDEGHSAVLIEPRISGAFNGKMRRNLPVVVCSTLQDLVLPDSSVAAIGCFDVFEHIENGLSFVSEINRVLKPDGLLYLTLPARQLLWSASDVYAGHFQRHNKKSAMLLLGDSFNILYQTFFFGCLTLPLFFLKAVPFRLGFLKERPNLFTHETEHGTSGGILVSSLSYLLRREMDLIRRGGYKSWGTSLLLVARKRK